MFISYRLTLSDIRWKQFFGLSMKSFRDMWLLRDQRRDRMKRGLIEEERENRKHTKENSTCNVSDARDDLWLTTNRSHMIRATYLIALASNEEKWSSVTNGRTLILIVSHEIYLSDMRTYLIFETLVLSE